VERVAIMAENTIIDPSMLPAYLFDRQPSTNGLMAESASGSRLEIMEKETLLESLARNDWVQQRAAREIGLTLRQMGYRVKKFNLGDIIRENKRARAAIPFKY
jgi:Nif-specific regulatory protein